MLFYERTIPLRCCKLLECFHDCEVTLSLILFKVSHSFNWLLLVRGAQFSQNTGLRGLCGYLRQIPILDMDPGHAVQPRLPELRGAGVGLGQTVLEVHQHLRVVLVLLHLGGGHQNCADPFGQVLDVRGEGGVLKQGRKDAWLSATSAHPHTSQMVRQSRE